jgi:hypothetical protein
VTLRGLLADVIARLERAAVPFMVTGSLASSYHGEPRASLDLDVVIDPHADSLERLVDELDAGGFYVDRAAAREAFRRRTSFNAIGRDAAKVDFIVRKDRPFSVQEFRRRLPAELLGTSGFIATAEDMVIAKLEWATASGSDRQLRDVAGILAAAGEAFDFEYVDRWAATLGLSDSMRHVRESIAR